MTPQDDADQDDHRLAQPRRAALPSMEPVPTSSPAAQKRRQALREQLRDAPVHTEIEDVF